MKRLTCSRIVLEGDSKTALSWINNSSCQRGRIPLLHDICQLIYSIDSSELVHVFGEGNAAVDWLATLFFFWISRGGWNRSTTHLD